MFKVYLTDESIEYLAALKFFKDCDAWARQHCPSYRQLEVVDVSDVSYAYDQVATYEFDDDKDAFWFTTAWKR